MQLKIPKTHQCQKQEAINLKCSSSVSVISRQWLATAACRQSKQSGRWAQRKHGWLLTNVTHWGSKTPILMFINIPLWSCKVGYFNMGTDSLSESLELQFVALHMRVHISALAAAWLEYRHNQLLNYSGCCLIGDQHTWTHHQLTQGLCLCASQFESLQERAKRHEGQQIRQRDHCCVQSRSRWWIKHAQAAFTLRSYWQYLVIVVYSVYRLQLTQSWGCIHVYCST